MGRSFHLYLFSWLGWLAHWLAPHKSCGLLSWNLTLCLELALYVPTTFFFCIKVVGFRLFEAPICIFLCPLAHKDSFFCDLGHLAHPLGLLSLFEAWHISACLLKKVPSFINFFWLCCFLHAYTLVACPYFGCLDAFIALLLCISIFVFYLLSQDYLACLLHGNLDAY